MFPRRLQPVLDRWSKGELDETTFMREVDWPQIWGFDDELYLPLFHFARMRRLPMLALNIDRATNRRVAAQGLASVPRTEREGVGDPAPASSFYRDRLFEWFKKHAAVGQEARPASERFERFVCAQQFWDRAMAEAIAGAPRDARRPLVVGIMGSGHIEYGDGAPYQLAALGIDDVVTVLPGPADTEYPIHDPPIADVLFWCGTCSDTCRVRLLRDPSLGRYPWTKPARTAIATACTRFRALSFLAATRR